MTGVKLNLRSLCVVLISLLSLIANAQIKYTLNFGIDDLKLWTTEAPDGTYYTSVDLNQCDNLLNPEGAPQLPVKHIRFLVPKMSTDFSVKIESTGTPISVQLPYRLKPIQDPKRTSNDIDLAFRYPEEDKYNHQSTIKAYITSEQVIDGYWHIVNIAICPTSYDDAEHTLLLEETLDITLNYRVCEEDEVNVTYLNDIMPEDTSFIKDIVVNYDESLFTQSRAASTTSPQQYNGSIYCIVTERSLIDAFKPLALWKEQKGYSTILIAIEDILSNPKYALCNTVPDNAAALRLYLKDIYKQKTSSGSVFCLLGGGEKTKVPIRKAITSNVASSHVSLFNSEPYIPTDNYFSDLSTEWELKQTPTGQYYYQYDNPEYVNNIYVGRLLCSTPDEVENYFSKLILYETNPGRGNTDYLDKALYFHQYNLKTFHDNNVTGEGLIFSKESIIEYTDSKISDTASETWPPGEDIINAMRRVGYSSWGGHGNPGSVGCSGVKGSNDIWEYISALDYYDRDVFMDPKNNNGLDNLNNEDYPSVAYSISCDIAPFDNMEYIDKNGVYGKYKIPYNMAESFTVGGSYGGVALLANTREGWCPYSNSLQNFFGKSIKNNRKLGIAEARSKLSYAGTYYAQNNLGRHVLLEHSLIGDPEMEMWIGKPDCMNISVTDNNNLIRISGVDLTGASVTIQRDDNYMYIPHATTLLQIERNRTSNNTNCNGLVLASIWKTGYLPEIILWTNSGFLNNDTKNFIVRQAYLGPSKYANNAGIFQVTDNGHLFIHAIDRITVSSNFIVSDGGFVSLECDKDIEVGDIQVKNNGVLSVTGDTISILPGFNISKGATVTITTKN